MKTGLVTEITNG